MIRSLGTRESMFGAQGLEFRVRNECLGFRDICWVIRGICHAIRATRWGRVRVTESVRVVAVRVVGLDFKSLPFSFSSFLILRLETRHFVWQLLRFGN